MPAPLTVLHSLTLESTRLNSSFVYSFFGNLICSHYVYDMQAGLCGNFLFLPDQKPRKTKREQVFRPKATFFFFASGC